MDHRQAGTTKARRKASERAAREEFKAHDDGEGTITIEHANAVPCPPGFGRALVDITAELQGAYEAFPVFNSGHEGLGVIEEEFIELRDEIFWGLKQAANPTAHRQKMRDEAVQLAAMAIRFMLDVCENPE